MSIFKRNKASVDPESTTPEGTQENAQVADLTAQVADLTAQLADANSVIDKYEAQENLRGKASEMGFEGDVAKLFASNDHDYLASLEAMITENAKADSAPLASENNQQFLEESGTPAGEGETGEDTQEASFKTSQEAILHARNELGMTQREATAHCRKTYPKLFGKGGN